MQKKLFFLALIVLVGISTNYAYSQEVSLATFQETAQIIVDKSISQNVTAINLKDSLVTNCSNLPSVYNNAQF